MTSSDHYNRPTTTQRKLTKSKSGLIELASYLANESEACKTQAFSRDSIYRTKKLYGEQGLEGLKEISRRKPSPGNRVPEAVDVQTGVSRPLQFDQAGPQLRPARLRESIYRMRPTPARAPDGIGASV